LPALLERLRARLAPAAMTVNGCTLGENIAGAKVWNDDVIRPRADPVTGDPATRGALAVLSGNLAPRGCVVKPSAASPGLMVHTGPALVFENHAEFSARVDDPGLPVTKDTVLVLKGAGPVGAPGFPEWATCTSRRSCWHRACATWCASRMRA
jgi:dihydroxy-acid dehydratase